MRRLELFIVISLVCLGLIACAGERARSGPIQAEPISIRDFSLSAGEGLNSYLKGVPRFGNRNEVRAFELLADSLARGIEDWAAGETALERLCIGVLRNRTTQDLDLLTFANEIKRHLVHSALVRLTDDRRRCGLELTGTVASEYRAPGVSDFYLFFYVTDIEGHETRWAREF